MSYAETALNNLSATIGSFKSKVDVKIDKVDTSTQSIQNTTDQIYQKIEQFKQDLTKGEQTQIAHENVMRIDQIIKEQFSNHIIIRKTVMGIVHDFDINLVRNSTIQELSEELWITSSQYWLSYALIAITAWVNDYPDVAKNALSECGRKDAVKTTLFFCLMNLRFNRLDAAKKWFCEYINILNPAMLQQETAVMLQAFLNGIFGKDKQMEDQITGLIDQWITVINEDAEVCSQLVDSYEKYIENTAPDTQFSYTAILNYCVNSGELQKSQQDVSRYQKLLELVQQFEVEAEPQNESNYKSRVDALLMNLISKYDSEELELRRQQEYYKCIIESKGDIEQAESRYQEMTALENEHFNIGQQMLKWAIYDDDSQTDIQVRKFGFQHTKSWFKTALEQFDAKVREQFPRTYDLKIDTWSGTSNGMDLDEQIQSIKNHYDNNKFHNIFINTPNLVALILLIVSAGLAFLTPFSLIATGGAAIFLGIRIFLALKNYPKRIQASLNQLNQVMNEITEFRRSFEQERGKIDTIMGIVDFL